MRRKWREYTGWLFNPIEEERKRQRSWRHGPRSIKITTIWPRVNLVKACLGVKRNSMGVEEKEEKERKIKELDWAQAQLTKTNSFGLFGIVGPGSCWAQYPAIRRPKPNWCAHPNLQSFTENPTSPIRSLAESNENFLNSFYLNSVCLIKYLCEYLFLFG